MKPHQHNTLIGEYSKSADTQQSKRFNKQVRNTLSELRKYGHTFIYEQDVLNEVEKQLSVTSQYKEGCYHVYIN